MVSIPLKLKYRNPNSRHLAPRQWEAPTGERRGVPEGTWVYSAGRFTSKSGNSGTAQRVKQGTGHRRRQGLGFTGRETWN